VGTTFDYNSATTAIVKFLRANSTTIDTNLYHSVSTILDFRPDDYKVFGNKFPAISVDLMSKTEERVELGLGANDRPIINCTFNIGCHINNFASYTAAYQSMRTLVSNVEAAIRSDDTISGTFALVNIESVEFGNIIEGKNGVLQKNGLITLNTVSYI